MTNETDTQTHETSTRQVPYRTNEMMWAGTCSCGFLTGKCLNEAEAKHRLDRHLSTTPKGDSQ